MPGGSPEGEHLGMGGGIGPELPFVVGAPDDRPARDGDRADGHVVVRKRQMCLGERQAHEPDVIRLVRGDCPLQRHSARPEGFEPPTLWSVATRSNPLS